MRKAADATCRRAPTQGLAPRCPRCRRCGRRQSAPRASRDDVEALNSAPLQPSERPRHSPGAAQGNGKCYSRPCILRARAFPSQSRRALSRAVAAGLTPSTHWTPTRRTGRLLRLARPDGSGRQRPDAAQILGRVGLVDCKADARAPDVAQSPVCVLVINTSFCVRELGCVPKPWFAAPRAASNLRFAP